VDGIVWVLGLIQIVEQQEVSWHSAEIAARLVIESARSRAITPRTANLIVFMHYFTLRSICRYSCTECCNVSGDACTINYVLQYMSMYPFQYLPAITVLVKPGCRFKCMQHKYSCTKITLFSWWLVCTRISYMWVHVFQCGSFRILPVVEFLHQSLDGRALITCLHILHVMHLSVVCGAPSH